MTLEELHSNEELRKHEFPVVAESIFLGHAGVCPLPRRVRDAIANFATDCTRGDQEAAMPPNWLKESRQLTADFIGARAEEVAFVGPTSLALSFIAEGLRFRRNQNVLIYQDDYPSNVYPWMTLANRGVEVRLLNIRQLGRIRARDVIGQVDENTRLVAIASCHFVAGFRADIEEIGEFLRKRGVLFCVDAIQTLGVFPTDVQNIDFMAADAHKWLLGPCAAGIMYARKEVQDEIRPTVHGWHNIRCPNYVAEEELEYKGDARRFEAGSHNLLGIAAIRAAIELLNEIGIEKIGREALRKRRWLVPELEAKGYTVLSAAAAEKNAGAMISIFKPGENMAPIHARLEENRIVTSLRTDRSGQRYIRISPHFYNTDAELHRTLELL